MAEPYCEPSDIKDAITDTDWGTTYDAILHNLAARASRLIDNLTGRRPGAYKLIADETLYFAGDNGTSLWIEMPQAPTEIAVDMDGDGTLDDYVVWPTTDYIMWPNNAAAFGEPFKRIDISMFSFQLFWPSWENCIKIIGRFGYSIAPPDDMVEAVVIQAGRWFKRGQQAFQDTGAIVELGKLTYTKQLDPDVAEIVSHYTRISL